MLQMPVYVVSVKSFTDRHELLQQQAKQHRLHLHFIWEHDADDLSLEDLSEVTLDAMPLKSISCAFKHLEAQRKLLETDHDIALVLEDDVLLFDDFSQRLSEVLTLVEEKDEPWLVFLGGMDNSLDSRFFDDDRLTLIESPITTAEAYLINRSGCELRLKWLDCNAIVKPADHLLKELDMLLGISQFRVSIPFVTQGSITGLFSTSLDSSRGKKPSWYLSARYRWNRWRKQVFPRMVSDFKKRF